MEFDLASHRINIDGFIGEGLKDVSDHMNDADYFAKFTVVSTTHDSVYQESPAKLKLGSDFYDEVVKVLNVRRRFLGFLPWDKSYLSPIILLAEYRHLMKGLSRSVNSDMMAAHLAQGFLPISGIAENGEVKPYKAVVEYGQGVLASGALSFTQFLNDLFFKNVDTSKSLSSRAPVVIFDWQRVSGNGASSIKFEHIDGQVIQFCISSTVPYGFEIPYEEEGVSSLQSIRLDYKRIKVISKSECRKLVEDLNAFWKSQRFNYISRKYLQRFLWTVAYFVLEEEMARRKNKTDEKVDKIRFVYFPASYLATSITGLLVTDDVIDPNSKLFPEAIDTGRKVSQLLARPIYELALTRMGVSAAVSEKKELRQTSTRAAIGSIMSRNGSHNIGSHVLSALSHNVGTMPDDRVLYQYIQHRMDYIATATTEFPQWTTPTMFVAGLMKNFYSQKHLLDYISRSEGLRAYKFQERNLDEVARMNQHGTIRVFIRKFFKLSSVKDQNELPPNHRYLAYDLNGNALSIYYFFGEKDRMFRQKFSAGRRMEYEVSESGGTAKFLESDEKFTPDWKQDIRIAIPGGIVGQHAFYTIIENVIRNAAKHGWAAEQNLREKDLEIFVDFHEEGEEVVFTVGDNVSDVFGCANEFWRDFFAEFACADCNNPFGWWRVFCSTDKRPELREMIKKQNARGERDDKMKNCWKGIGKILFPEDYTGGCDLSVEVGKSDSQKAEELQQNVKIVKDLLLRSYAMPLESVDASLLEQYLRKDCADNEEISLPLLYQLQREYLVYAILRYNVDYYIVKASSVNGELTCVWRKEADLPKDILENIIDGEFSKVIADDVDSYERLATSDEKILCSKAMKMIMVWAKSKRRYDKKHFKNVLEAAKVSLVEDRQLITPDIIWRLCFQGGSPRSALEYLVQTYLMHHISDDWIYKKFLTTNVPSRPDWDLGHRVILPLHHAQQCKLAQTFIDSDGKLRKENWGLAEMKISAGYLAQRKIEEIGGLDAKGNDILVPIAMPGVCRNADNPHNCLACSEKTARRCYNSDPNCPLKNNRFHLGYRFRVAKPKDILIILGDESEKSAIKSVATVFGDNGIHFAYYSRVDDKVLCTRVGSAISDGMVQTLHPVVAGFNYRYVVAPDQIVNDQLLNRQFAFRLITTNVLELRDDKGEVLKNDSGEIVSLTEFILNPRYNDGVGCRILRKSVHSAWIRQLAQERYDSLRVGKESPVRLVVNVDGNDKGSERGLVTVADLLRTMFLECYHTALISFLKNPPPSLDLGDATKRLVMLLSLIKVMPDKMEMPQQDYGHGADMGAKEYIRKQLVSYCDLLKSHLLLSSEFVDALKSMENYGHDAEGEEATFIARKIEDIERDFEKAMARRLFRGKYDADKIVREGCEDLIAYLRKTDKSELDGLLDAFHGASKEYQFPERGDSYGTGRHSFEDNLRAVITACSVPEEDEFNALVESLNSMFLASDVYLRKYEERIATLPEAYKHDGSEKGQKQGVGSNVTSLQDIADYLLLRVKPDDKKTSADMGKRPVVKYSRHDKSRPENAVYSEALSGSQSYLNALARLVYATKDDEKGERYAAVARLLENAFLRILIIDERVMNFVNERSSDEMVKTFINMGIWVADVEHFGMPIDIRKVKDKLYRLSYEKSIVEKNDVGSNGVGTNKDEKRHSKYTSIPSGVFDLLIIHQGIIDKWWDRHDKEKVETILNDLRKSIPRVVVTTGRGRPENIPDTEKVLPFSVIESSLFRGYPEKLILVNTVMNLLPYGNKEEPA